MQSASLENDLPVSKRAHYIWDRYMRSYDYLNTVDSYTRNINDIAERVDPSPGMKILDAGSGTGNLSELLASRGADVLSCDVSASALEVHKKKNPLARVLKASLEEPLPLKDNEYDAVCCASVLFALSKNGCKVAMSEFRRILRPGGLAVITVATPTKSNFGLLRKHLRDVLGKRSWREVLAELLKLPALLKILHYNQALQKLPDWQGYHRFTETELRELAESAGFSDISVGRTYAGGFYLLTAKKPTSVEENI